MDIMIVDDQENIRIDAYISKKHEELSRSNIQRLIANEKILVNGNIVKDSYKVKMNDEITIETEEPKEIDIKSEDIEIEVVYEDEDIIVVNKPKGMVTHPAVGNYEGTLVNALMFMCKDSLSGINGEIRPGIVHRLDKDTSGILIVAKNNTSHINLTEQIKNREVKKIYIALVRGKILENEGSVYMPISRHKTDRKKMAVNSKGKEAITHFKVLKRYNDYTLLEIQIETGRTHQIRVHMSQIGYPIVGDISYSNGKNPFGIVGQMLHSKQIEFLHPKTKKTLKLEAPLPQYFEKVIEELEKEKSNV